MSVKYNSVKSKMNLTTDDMECRPILYEIEVKTPKMPNY